MACFLGERKVKSRLQLSHNGNGNGKAKQPDRLAPFHPCPFVDGNKCHNDCPLYGEVVLTLWKIELNKKGKPVPCRIMKDFHGCLLAAGMVSLTTMANETFE